MDDSSVHQSSQDIKGSLCHENHSQGSIPRGGPPELDTGQASLSISSLITSCAALHVQNTGLQCVPIQPTQLPELSRILPSGDRADGEAASTAKGHSQANTVINPDLHPSPPTILLPTNGPQRHRKPHKNKGQRPAHRTVLQRKQTREEHRIKRERNF